MGYNRGWPDAQIDEMFKLLEQGKSAGVVGAAIGRSRNAVIGMTMRLGKKVGELNKFWLKQSVERKAYVLRAKPRLVWGQKERPVIKYRVPRMPTMVKKPVPKPKPTAPHRSDIHVVGLPLMRLKMHACHWPMWDEPPQGQHLYCGLKAVKGSSYCEWHEALSFRVPQIRREPVKPFVMRNRPAKSPKSMTA